MIDVYLPGTGGMIPLPERWLTCCWVEYQGAAILIDCGEGTQIAIKKAGIKPSRLELLLITHFHADHIAGLAGLLLTLANMERTHPLTIAGPPGLRRIVTALTVIAPRLPYSLDIIELDKHSPQSLGLKNVGGHVDAGTSPVTISALPLRHGMTCFGYRIDLKRKPVFNPEKAAALNIPVKFYKSLHKGESVTLDDGREIHPEQVLDGERESKSVCYFTDTMPFLAMSDFAKGVDLLISEGMYYDEQMRQKIEEKNHMLFSDSAKLAAKCGAKKLWLTHYSPALEHPKYGEKFARKIFPDTTAVHDGVMMTIDS
ncbi:MAG: ribonuclease Z [Oscillospiraceae bacterium]|nr:ribonuclease Z [Oscillospiraceae bacterium]